MARLALGASSTSYPKTPSSNLCRYQTIPSAPASTQTPTAPSTSRTFTCLGVIIILNGTGDRPESPSYSFRSIGSPGSSAISKAQSIREMASQISRSATIMPGQIRRLERRISTFAPGCRNGLGERTLRRTSNDLARMDRPGLRSRLR
jgi:hypothetical protein